MKHLIKSFIFVLMMIVLPMTLLQNRLSFAADTTKTYYTVYDGETKNNVLFLKGDDVNIGDKYLSKDNNLYEIVKVDDGEKIAYTKFLRK
ncbi:MAG: stage II sporulation protein P, partial [Clostridia bacterium]|nr:stage II sporulation protein P [Clostridia bacterium]